MPDLADTVLATPGLRSFWQLQELAAPGVDAGPDADNLTEFPNPAGVSFGAAGPFGDRAWSFDGSANAFVRSGDLTALSFAGVVPFAVECMCFPTSAGNGVVRAIVSKRGTDGGGGQGWDVRLSSGGTVQMIRQRDSVTLSCNGANVVHDAWNHILCVFDGTEMRCIVNRVESAPTVNDKTLVATSSVGLTVGGLNFSGSSFIGRIAYVAIYDGVLHLARAHQHARVAAERERHHFTPITFKPVAGKEADECSFAYTALSRTFDADAMERSDRIVTGDSRVRKSLLDTGMYEETASV